MPRILWVAVGTMDSYLSSKKQPIPPQFSWLLFSCPSTNHQLNNRCCSSLFFGYYTLLSYLPPHCQPKISRSLRQGRPDLFHRHWWVMKSGREKRVSNEKQLAPNKFSSTLDEEFTKSKLMPLLKPKPFFGASLLPLCTYFFINKVTDKKNSEACKLSRTLLVLTSVIS